MNNNSNKNVNRQNCACALCTDEGLRIYLQMHITGVCYLLFRWVMAWGKNCSCVWMFWCSVLCSAGQRATVQRESELVVRGPE